MLSGKYRDKLLLRFPYLFEPESAAELSSDDPAISAPAAERLLESILRLLGGIFLRQVLVHGVSNERVTRFLEQEMSALPLERWLEFQKLVLEERHVPFEEVFSLEFRRRDLLLLINRRYLGYLTSLQSRMRRSGSLESGHASEPSVVGDFVEFMLTYFKSDVAAGRDGELVLVNKEREEVLELNPIVIGTLDDVEIFTGLSEDGALYFSLAERELRDRQEADLLAKLGDCFLKVGAYRQAIGTFERMNRAGHTTDKNDSALYASHCYLGLEQYRKGKFHQAIAEFEKAMRIRSDMPQLHYNLALSYARLNNFGRATQILTALVEEHPEAERGYELLGDLYQMTGDRDTARKMYDRALLVNPHNRAVEQKRRRLSDDSKPKGSAGKPQARSANGQAPPEEESKIEELLVDLSAEAEQGRLHHIVGREQELAQMVEILSCEARSNPLLMGEPGVGKTAIVEELALRLVEGRVPGALKGTRVYLMSVATLLAGAKFRGQFEERILGLVSELKEKRCILFIDDIHTIVNSGLSKGGTLDTSNLLKPALVRGEIQAIGATSFDEFRNNIEKDPSLVRCFQLVGVEEPDPELMVDILASHIERLCAHHGVTFEGMELGEIARLVSICLRDRRLPDAAVTVLDRAAARVSLRTAEDEVAPASVRREDVIAVIAEMSGVPIQRLSATESDRFLNLESILSQRVVGQQAAVEAVSRVLRTTRMDLDIASQRPNGVFLFVGPTGVGKTELAKAMAQFLFGDEEKLIRIDMSEYMEKISASRLIGTAPGYVGYNDQNQLTDQVRKLPYSLVLLDEIEKADSQMLNLFLQVFDAGRLTDGKGRTVSFSNTTIVMTSNVGTRLYGQPRAGYSRAPVGEGELQREIKRYFTPEFLNRIDEVAVFTPLSDDELAKIARLQLSQVTERLAKQGIELIISDAVYRLLVVDGASIEYGARNLARTLRRRVLDPLAHRALHSQWDQVRRVLLDVTDGQVAVSLLLQGDVELEAAELAGSGETDLEANE